MTKTDHRYLLTVTANFSDGTEADDIEVPVSVPEDELGEAAVDASTELLPDGTSITSLVIVAMVA